MMEFHALGHQEKVEYLPLLMPEEFQNIAADQRRDNLYVGSLMSTTCGFALCKDVCTKRFHVQSATHSMILALLGTHTITHRNVHYFMHTISYRACIPHCLQNQTLRPPAPFLILLTLCQGHNTERFLGPKCSRTFLHLRCSHAGPLILCNIPLFFS